MDVVYKGRKIYLLGTTRYTRELIEDIGKNINIAGILDITGKWKEDSFCTYKVFSYEEIKSCIDGLIIDCSNEPHVEERLIFDGFELYKDYIDSRYFRWVVCPKPIIIVHGLCDLWGLSLILRRLSAFSETYHIYYFGYDKENNTKYSNKVLNRLINVSSIYIYSGNGHNILNFTKKEIPTNCKSISIPTTRFSGVWPQINPNRTLYTNQYYFRPQHKLDGAFIGGDREINKRIDAGIGWEEIYAEISSLQFFTPEIIDQTLERGIRSMEYFEGNTDLKIVDFVKDNFRKRHLFNDYLHCKKIILNEYTKQIAHLLGLEITDTDLAGINGEVHMYTEMPIYPSVAKHLGLEWVTSELKYYIRSYSEPQHVTFKEYVHWYYEYACAVRAAKKNW